MNDKQAETTPITAASKSFMTAGPTLHYSHDNVLRCWLLAVAVFGVCCFFWSKILTGSFWPSDFRVLTSPQLWQLDRSVATGVNIFEYPWQILVLGLLMGILAIVPVLISQLMSFSYSLPFILGVAFLADLPAFAGCLLISCLAVACRPLRFRSRFTAIALCTAPQLLYWGYFSSARAVEPIKWAFSFAPWVLAWLIGLGIAGLVLGIGHFARYRPGLVWMSTSLFLLLAIVTFEMRIGFDELDYQLYVAKNNPEDVTEFHDHTITAALDETIRDPVVRRYLAGFFYPEDPIPLRADLKSEIQAQLALGFWPGWFNVPPNLSYQKKRQSLLDQYEWFIDRRSKSRRMPIVLYYKALLKDYRPDISMLGQKETLHFYSEYPDRDSLTTWYRLYDQFGQSPESVEARYRIAMHLPGQGEFSRADELLAEAQTMIAERLKLSEQAKPANDTFFSLFRPPADSAITPLKLADLQRRVNQLRSLISAQNRAGDQDARKRLAAFVLLDPHAGDYRRRLDELLKLTGDHDPLRDNILLAQTNLVPDEQLRAEKIAQLHKEFQDTDGGVQALYELGLLKIRLYQNESNPEKKKDLLADARATLTSFVSLYPDSFFAEHVQKNLDDLPTVD
ncbi:MAG TPA: hypothetical protein VMX13_09870 [Sedimentisphaerales bacterium]|nr:hypothetical protein [Sedimentisphaerales bacterium]